MAVCTVLLLYYQGVWQSVLYCTVLYCTTKVCGSLPMNSDNPCTGQAGVCTYSDIGGNRTDPVNLGLMRQKPVINSEDHPSL